MKAIFEKVEELAEESLDSVTAAKAANEALRELFGETERRINADQEKARERIKELQKKLKSDTVSDTLKRVYRREIDELKSKEFFPTEAEKESIMEEIDNLAAATADINKTFGDYYSAYKEILKELESKKAEVMKYGSISFDEWVKGDKKRFNDMCKPKKLSIYEPNSYLEDDDTETESFL